MIFFKVTDVHAKIVDWPLNALLGFRRDKLQY